MMEPNNAKRHKIDRNQQEDEISQLPEYLLHHILYFLPIKDATQTSCLSTTWNAAWKSSPVLEFNQIAFERTLTLKGYKNRLQAFCNHVDESIRRRRRSNIPIQKFKLSFNVVGSRNKVASEDVYRWLDYATSNKLDLLVINCHRLEKNNPTLTEEMWPFLLPESVFRVKSLKKLKLHGCKIPIGTTSEFSLQKLDLSHVQVDQHTFQCMLSSNHLLEQVSINECKGFEKVQLTGLKLDRVELVPSRYQSQSIGVEAPNLQAIIYDGNIESSITDCNCKNLKVVILDQAKLTLNLLRCIPFKFPAVEKLELSRCSFHTSHSRLLIHGSVKRRELEARDLYSHILSLETDAVSLYSLYKII